MSFILQFQRQIRHYIYNPVYKGPFEYKKKDTKMYNYPFGINKGRLEEKFAEINEIRAKPLNDEDISPFHLVWRYKHLYGNPWNHKLILKRLGLHRLHMKSPVIIPNTPHYNSMLWEIKHLIRLKPLKFPDGLPTEDDLGSIKVDLETGEMRINRAFRIPKESLDKSDPPPLFRGKYLREYLKWSSGLIGFSLPHHDIDDKDGNRIEDYDRKMKNYYQHQHVYYNNNNNNGKK